MKEIEVLKDLNHIFNLIMGEELEAARGLLKKYENNSEYESYDFEINCLRSYLQEKSEILGENKEKVNEFLTSGKKSYYFGDISEASDIFKAGKYVTDCNVFDFLTGKVLYMDYNTREEGIEYLEKYVNEGGGMYLLDAYSTLGKFYSHLDSDISESYIQKARRIKSITPLNNEMKRIYELNNE